MSPGDSAGLQCDGPGSGSRTGGTDDVVFPLTFLSNVFVDPATLPSVLRAFVEVNPISLLATASRGLMDGNAQGADVAGVLAVAVGLTAVFAPLTTLLYRPS